MRSIIFLGVVLIFTVAVDCGNISRNITDCSRVSENLNISEVMPIKYDVRIIVRPGQRVLSGILNVLIDIKKPMSNISLHAVTMTRGYDTFLSYATNITMFDSFLKTELGRISYKLFKYQYCDRKNVLFLKFNETLSKGKYRLTLIYRSITNLDIQNIFYPTTWTSQNQKWLLTNLYTPHAIRGFFPCWDDPRVKATYNISVQFPTDYTVLSTMSEIYSSYVDPALTTFGIKFIQFKELILMPTHLIAFLIVGDITMDFDKRDIHYMWHKIDAGKRFTYLLEMAENATCYIFINMKINSSFISPKINHVVLPNSPMKSMGAPGLVVYRERDIFFDAALDFPGRYLDVMVLITYEMARQLFLGAVIQYSNVDYVWLNEMFSSFFGYYITTKVSTQRRTMELFVVKIIQPALDSDTFLERKPILSKTKNSGGIDALLYPVLYHKKAFALIRMLFKLYNTETFIEAIKKYVHERTKDVWTILEEAYSLRFESGYTVKDIIDTWLTAKHHPELFIQRDYEKWTADCISSLTFIEGKPEWIIPVNYITESSYESYNISEVLWLKWGKVKRITAISSDDFLIVNAEQLGYYRVNYDTRNWLMISTYLQKKNFSHIPSINRAQLINDAYYFTIKNQLETYIFVNITRHLKLDTDFVGWYPMFNILSYMSIYFQFSESNRIKRHFLEILDGVSTIVGFEDNSEDDIMRISLRYLIRKWACKFGHSACRGAALDRLMNYINIQDETHKVPAVSKEWVFCDALKLENLNVWKNILNRSMVYNNMELLNYLSCTENTTIIIYYLTLILRTDHFSEIKQSMGPICRNIVKKHVRRSTVLRFVIDNYERIQVRFPQDFPPGILLSDIIMNVYSLDDLDMVQELASKSTWITDDIFKAFDILISQWKKYLRNVLSKFQMFHIGFKIR
ncbi:aminopeptidase N-like [Odontomachus brunneus]|uniref:aminopeptidase N-like n=1 Tax=Odontomachus brunneus TaxID=486640 RepID=UPI0013F23FFF|nr:aminopeptidase N-like [Odontomachus brunneus]XP_032687685.1 aminopeptidase N-like [Odontomachus brunneus]XP_032687687.1 aminopeptidase N-like [Odontomachus brunneus]XP_032687688.1 aminopeptidase N-like [Odontomachus brunneus]